MNQYEANRGPNFGWDDILAARARVTETYNPFFPTDVMSTIEHKILPANRDFLLGFATEDGMLSVLTTLQKSLEPARSPRLLTTKFMGGIVDTSIIEGIRAAYNQKSLVLFVVACDFGLGFCDIPKRILQTEEYSHTRSDDVIARDVSEAGRIIGASAGEQADAYLKDIAQIKSYAQILDTDPSGFELVDKIVTDVEEELKSNPSPMTVREFTVEGVKTGALLYKAIYPKAQKILQQ